jgi:mannosyltransferase
MSAVVEALDRGQVPTRSRVVSATPAVWVGGLIVLAALLRLPALGSQSFWYDESFTVQLVHLGPLQMLHGVGQTEATPPLYYALAWGWSRVFGFGELGLRSLSAVLGIATVPVAYAAAAALVSRRAGIVTAALVATSPFLVWYSQEARSYALFVLTGAVSLYFFARARDGFAKRALIGWAVASCLALTAHYGALFLVVPEAVWLLARARSRRGAVLRAVAPIGAVSLALVPLALYQHPNRAWISQSRLGPRVEGIPRVFIGGVSSPAVYLTVAIGVLWAGGLTVALLWGGHRERRAARVAAALGAACLGIAILSALGGIDVVLARNVIVAWLPLAVATAAGFASRRAGRAGLLAAGAAAALSAGIVLAMLSNTGLQRADWRAAAHALGPAPAAGSRLIVAPGGYRAKALTLALDGARDARLAERLQVSEVDVVGFDGASGYACWSGAACNLPRTRAPLTLPVGGFRPAGRRRAGLFEVARFTASGPTTVDSARLGHPAGQGDGPAVFVQSPSAG